MFVYPAFSRLLFSIRPVSCRSLSLLLPAWRRGTCQSQWRTWALMRLLSPSAWPLTSMLEESSSSWWKRHVGHSLSACVCLRLSLRHRAQTKNSYITYHLHGHAGIHTQSIVNTLTEINYTPPIRSIIMSSCIT